jgi:hypothetical protein
VESSGREARGGWESQQGSKVRDPQSIDMWGQFSSLGPGEGQGTSPGQRRPVSLSQVSAPDIRNCRITTMPRVEKKDLLGAQTARLTLRFRVQQLSRSGWGFYRRSHTVREEVCSSQRTARPLASIYL